MNLNDNVELLEKLIRLDNKIQDLTLSLAIAYLHQWIDDTKERIINETNNKTTN